MKTLIKILIVILLGATSTLINGCAKEGKVNVYAYVEEFHQDEYSEWGYYNNGKFHHVLSAFALEHKDKIDIKDTSFVSTTGVAIVVKDKVTYIDLGGGNLKEIEHRLFYDNCEVKYGIDNNTFCYIEHYSVRFKLIFEDNSIHFLDEKGYGIQEMNNVNYLQCTFKPIIDTEPYGKKIIKIEVEHFYIHERSSSHIG